jgi:hypothetical protein
LSSTIQRLERELPRGVSVFERHRFTIVSTDFIKTSGRAEDFVRECPKFVIVDEAHGCTLAGGVGRGRQQRFELLRRVAEDESRHLVLVTATPHSGNEEAFRSLLSLLDQDFAHLPTDLDTAEREGIRRQLARHLVQRRRADIRHFLETDTAFPDRKDKETTYAFSQDYRALFDDILAFARDYVSEEDGSQRRRRVRYWSALALLPPRPVPRAPAASCWTSPAGPSLFPPLLTTSSRGPSANSRPCSRTASTPSSSAGSWTQPTTWPASSATGCPPGSGSNP